jgi:SAM-dependent methyltransferase
VNRVIYQHPLAYLLGLEGLALLRAFSGLYGRDFTIDRFQEIRALLDSVAELGEGVEARPIQTREGYARWSAFYDEPGNELIDIEQPIVREILDGLPIGIAVDAACGTGRHAAYLASLGHSVIGIDTSPEMLAVAREKLPAAEFHEADLHDLPLADDSADLVVCALALTHVPDLRRALAEFVRVLRPNGHLVVSDSRGLIGDLSPPMVRTRADGTFGYMQTWTGLRATTSRLRFRWGSRSGAASSRGGRRPYSTTTTRTPTMASRRPRTFPAIRRTSGRCTSSASPPRTRPSRATPSESSGISSSLGE